MVGGGTAINLDVQRAAAHDTGVIIPLTLGIVVLILTGLLRAVVAPLILLGTVVLSFGGPAAEQESVPARAGDCRQMRCAASMRPGWLPGCARIPPAARGRLQRRRRVWTRGLTVVSESIRVEGSVTSLSWIPREAIEGMTKIPFEVSVTSYDQPPPDRLTEGSLETLQDAGRFRFVNRLSAWAEIEDGKIVRYGHEGQGLIGRTRVKLGRFLVAVPPVPFPVLRAEPVATETEVRFVQTAGGRTGVPAPRTVKHPPFAQWLAPVAWTTISLTLRAEGTATGELVGASPFPRHWVYDGDGNLAQKSGLIDFREWYHNAFGAHSPWGDQDSPALVTAVETALERELSKVIIDAEPRFVRLRPGESLVRQDDEGTDVFLLFDGVMQVIHNEKVINEIGPGAILGEMALVDNARRNSTLLAATHCRVAVMPGQHLDREALAQVAEGRREALD